MHRDFEYGDAGGAQFVSANSVRPEAADVWLELFPIQRAGDHSELPFAPPRSEFAYHQQNRRRRFAWAGMVALVHLTLPVASFNVVGGARVSGSEV